VGVRDRLRRGAADYLQPGEQIQAVFLASRPSHEYYDRAVVATDQRLLLYRLNFLSRPTELIAEADRNTKIGPCHGVLFYRFDTFEAEHLVVHRRLFSDVAEADRLAGF
jgi:hypothetical protein